MRRIKLNTASDLIMYLLLEHITWDEGQKRYCLSEHDGSNQYYLTDHRKFFQPLDTFT